MTSNLKRALVLATLALSASACSSNNNNRNPADNVIAPPVVVATPKQEDQFGVVFGTAYRAVMDSEPYSPQEGDIVPISLTTEPVAVN